MRKFVGINMHGSVFSEPLKFFTNWIDQRMPIAFRSLTWIDALYEMFPNLSRSEINRRIKSGAFSPGDTMTWEETKEEIGIKPMGGNGFDCQIINFGKLRGIVACSQELMDNLQDYVKKDQNERNG